MKVSVLDQTKCCCPRRNS